MANFGHREELAMTDLAAGVQVKIRWLLLVTSLGDCGLAPQ
jgi:hypothetical protein